MRASSFVSLAWVSLACASACAKGGNADGLAPLPLPEGGARVDGGDAGEDAKAPLDGAGGTDACTLGSSDHCGACGTTCGTTDAQTTFACTDATTAGTCTVTCRGEFYDLDGKADNGCEAGDLVVQDSAASAKPVTLDGTTRSANELGYVYSDDRAHENVPLKRPAGREDWYVVTVTVPEGGAAGSFGACLGITNFPNDDVFEVCTTDANATTFSHCAPVAGGGASTCVKPAANADAGVYFVRVKKVSGSNTANGYALFLQH